MSRSPQDSLEISSFTSLGSISNWICFLTVSDWLCSSKDFEGCCKYNKSWKSSSDIMYQRFTLLMRSNWQNYKHFNFLPISVVVFLWIENIVLAKLLFSLFVLLFILFILFFIYFGLFIILSIQYSLLLFVIIWCLLLLLLLLWGGCFSGQPIITVNLTRYDKCIGRRTLTPAPPGNPGGPAGPVGP